MNQSNLIRTDYFVLGETRRSSIKREVYHYKNPRAASIEALRITQKQRGWVPDGAISMIGEVLGIPASDVEGVTTFYSRILRQPVGRHIIRVCDSMVCYINGHESMVGKVQKQFGISLGQTTADGHSTLLPVCYLGNCDKIPALITGNDTRGDVCPDGVAKPLEAYV